MMSSSLSTSDESKFVPRSVGNNSFITDQYVIASNQTTKGNQEENNIIKAANTTQGLNTGSNRCADVIDIEGLTISPTPEPSPCSSPILRGGISNLSVINSTSSGCIDEVNGVASGGVSTDVVASSLGSLGEYEMIDGICSSSKGSIKVENLSLGGEDSKECWGEEEHKVVVSSDKSPGSKDRAMHSQVCGEELEVMLENFSPNSSVPSLSGDEDSRPSLASSNPNMLQPDSSAQSADASTPQEVSKSLQRALTNSEVPMQIVDSKKDTPKNNEPKDIKHTPNSTHIVDTSAPADTGGSLSETAPASVSFGVSTVSARDYPKANTFALHIAQMKDSFLSISGSVASFVVSAVVSTGLFLCDHIPPFLGMGTARFAQILRGIGKFFGNLTSLTTSWEGAERALFQLNTVKVCYAVASCTLISIALMCTYMVHSSITPPEDDLYCFSTHISSYDSIPLWELNLFSAPYQEPPEEEVVLVEQSSRTALSNFWLKPFPTLSIIISLLFFKWKVYLAVSEEPAALEENNGAFDSSTPVEYQPDRPPTPLPDRSPISLSLTNQEGRPPHALSVGTRAIVHKHDADGNCEFRGLAWGWNRLHPNSSPLDPVAVRQDLALLVKKNGSRVFNGKPLRAWIGMEFPELDDIEGYVSMMLGGAWGGTVEMVLFARYYGVSISVYTQRVDARGERVFHPIHIITDERNPSRDTIHLLYKDGTHYDSLISGQGINGSVNDIGPYEHGTVGKKLASQDASMPSPFATPENEIVWSEAAMKRKNELLHEEISCVDKNAEPDGQDTASGSGPMENQDVLLPLRSKLEQPTGNCAGKRKIQENDSKKLVLPLQEKKNPRDLNGGFTQELEEKDGLIGEADRQIAQLTGQVQKLKEGGNRLSEENSRLVGENAALNERMELAEISYTSFDQARATLEVESAQLNEKLEILPADNKDSSDTSDRMNEGSEEKDVLIAEANRQNAKLAEELRELMGEKCRLVEENNRLVFENVTLNERVELTESVFSNLEQTIATLEYENASVIRNIIESVPLT